MPTAARRYVRGSCCESKTWKPPVCGGYCDARCKYGVRPDIRMQQCPGPEAVRTILSAGPVNQRLVFTGDPATAAAGSGSLELQAAQFRRRAQERQEAEAKAEQARSEAVYALHNCIEARGRLRGLEEGQRFSREDAITGERIQFSDEERLADARRQRTTAEQWCIQ